MTINKSKVYLILNGIISVSLILDPVFLEGQTIAQKNTHITTYAWPNLEFKQLAIGDKVPDFEFQLLNYAQKKARLSDFSGKYIILDFWATWCTSCLYNFPKLDSIQRKYFDRLQILLVNAHDTRDDEAKLMTFFAKRKNRSGNRYILPTLIEDSLTSKLFPHKTIPHFVWIDKNGFVRAISESEYVNFTNVKSFLDGDALKLPVKKDLDYDFTKPLFVNGNGGSHERFIYRSSLTGYLDGFPSSGGTFTDDSGKVVRFLDMNTSILSLYRHAYKELGQSPDNRIILDVGDKTKYLVSEGAEWREKYAVTYEMILPPTTIEKAKKIMQDDLRRFFGLKVTKQTRNSPCLVLKNSGALEKILSTEGASATNLYDDDFMPKFIRNYPISELIHHLNNNLSIPVIDETGFSEKVNLELPADVFNISLLRAALKKYGFDLVEKNCDIEFYVLSESEN